MIQPEALDSLPGHAVECILFGFTTWLVLFIFVTAEYTKDGWQGLIILSALAEPDVIKQCIELGAHDYVTKPYTSDDLLNRISSVLGSARSAEPDCRAQAQD